MLHISSEAQGYCLEVDNIILDEFYIVNCHRFLSNFTNSLSIIADKTPAPNETARIVDSNSGANIKPRATQKPRQGAQLNGLKFSPSE
jgi:hypothetical protein